MGEKTRGGETSFAENEHCGEQHLPSHTTHRRRHESTPLIASIRRVLLLLREAIGLASLVLLVAAAPTAAAALARIRHHSGR